VFKKSVDAVMTVFHKTIAELQKVEAHNRDEAAVLEAEAKVLMASSTHCMEEADRAQRIREKMTEIVA
jgi:hypothetical protein